MASDEAVRLPGLPPGASADPAYRFLSPHQAAVLDAATRRLVSGPVVEMLELSGPGAYEAHVVSYMDRLLSVFDVTPTDRRAGGPLRQRVADLRDQYNNGIAMLDQQAGGDFTALPPLRQDLILFQSQVAPFASLLFEHIIDAMYAGRCVAPRDINRCDDPPSGIAMA